MTDGEKIVWASIYAVELARTRNCYESRAAANSGLLTLKSDVRVRKHGTDIAREVLDLE